MRGPRGEEEGAKYCLDNYSRDAEVVKLMADVLGKEIWPEVFYGKFRNPH